MASAVLVSTLSLAAGLTAAACAGPDVPRQQPASGSAGSAGAAATGGSAGGAGVSTAGGAGTTGGGSAGGGNAGTAGGGNAGLGGAGSAGSKGLIDAPCDFSSAGTDCVTCGGSTCIDTSSDPGHCGACGHACPQGEACKQGVCGRTIVTGAGAYNPGVLLGGRLYAWGANEYMGTWGADGGPLGIYTPREVKALGNDLADAVTGDATCGVSPDGTVRCFGLNASGQLGTGQLGGNTVCGPAMAKWCTPTPQISLMEGVTEIREGVFWCGGTHLCARRADRTVACWGDLGSCAGNKATAIPAEFSLPPSAGIAVYAESSCSRSCTGRVHCWGTNGHYALGTTGPSSLVPAEIPNLRLTSLVAGYCGVREDRKVVCWGDSGLGGAGVIGDTLPTVVAGVSDVVQLSRGGATCALTGGGEVWCWGAKYGVGGPSTCQGDACPTPIKVNVADVVELSSGSGTTMARLANGTYVAWGINGTGQIGNGGITDSLTPTPVKGLPPP